MRCPPELGVKQFVAVVRGAFGNFMVFETGDAKVYLFCAVDSQGIQTGLSFPVRKSDLRPDVARALRHGWGNANLISQK